MQHLSPWNLLALDWDGPSVASAKMYYASVREAFRCAKLGPAPSFAFFRDAVSASVDQFYERVGLTAHLTKEEVQRIRNDHFERHLHRLRPTPGIHELMRAASRRRIPIIILSSNERRFIEPMLRRFDLHRFVIDVIESHNKKEELIKLSKRFGVPFRKILFVEDSSEPIVAANELGVSTVAFLGGFNSQVKLLAANPMFISQHMRDVTGLITQ